MPVDPQLESRGLSDVEIRGGLWLPSSLSYLVPEVYESEYEDEIEYEYGNNE